MNKITFGLINLISAFIIIASIIYAGLWFTVANIVNKKIDDIWNNQEKFQITINGDKPRVSGFPSPPQIVFSGTITDQNGTEYKADGFRIEGFPIPGLSVKMTGPNGLAFSGPILKTPVELDYFKFKIKLPTDFPQHFDYASIKQWQENGGVIPVERLLIVRNTLNLRGEGELSLDENLQLTGLINTKLQGLDDLVYELAKNGTIDKKHILLAQSVINFVSKIDEETNETYVVTGIILQRGGVFIGPIRVGSLPEWKWEK